MNAEFRPKGMVFDFNGTLIDDTLLQREVWRRLFPVFMGREMAEGEYEARILGKTNNVILRSYFPDITPEREYEMLSRKEAFYRDVMREDPEKNIVFYPGVVETLDGLRERGVPFTIATASEITNVEFYFSDFGLNRWFSGPDDIVYDNGTFPGKPEPDIYRIAAKRLGATPADCVVAEDTLAGITAAKRAGMARIFAINPILNRDTILNDPEIYRVLPDFVGFIDRWDRNDFN